MKTHPKQSYHPFILVAFYLHILPGDLLDKIPRSTQYDWQHKQLTELFGYDWYCQNLHLFHTLQQVAVNHRLLQVNKALIRVFALQRFLQRHKIHIRSRLFNAASTAVANTRKVQQVLGHRLTLKLLQLTNRQYHRLRQKTKCVRSLFNLCLPKHPSQLLPKETNVIKSYCTDPRYIYWPMASLYHRIIRDGAARFHINTFYKYISLLNLERTKPAHRRKNHHTGIRAFAPLQLLHADITEFKTADNGKAYIIQDNFSRGILQYAVALQRKASITKELLEKVHSLFLRPAGINACQFMTDDGSENYGPVQHFIHCAEKPSLQHIVAQSDVEFSNSMIEAAHKNLKYRFLYHKHIPDFNSLCNYLPQAIEDFNNRPHHVLDGLTPLEVLNGKAIDKNLLCSQMVLARMERFMKNKQEKCCDYSF